MTQNRSKERVVCPACREAGKRSAIRTSPAAVTAMPVRTFYDEEGRKHLHDPNSPGEVGVCSEGHRLNIHHSNECPASGCDFGHPFGVTLESD